MIQSKTKTPSMQWKRAPLALAIAMALGSPVLHAQIQPSHIPTDSSTEQITSQLAGIELVVIDAAVEDRASLLKAVPHGAEWLVLDSSRDGMVQLAEIASRYQNISALHLLSHGEDGLLKLGNSELNQQNLGAYQKELATLAAAMAPGADLLLYGCEVAKTAKGEQFIQQIKAATGLDIAASNDVTQDSEWELEIAQGSIETMSLTPEGYSGSLISIPPSGYIMAGDGSGGGGGGAGGIGYYGGNGGAGGGDDDELTGTAGNDVLFGDGSGGGGGGHNQGFSKYSSTLGAGSAGDGGGGADTLNGGAGNDILFGDGFAGSDGYGLDGGAGGFSGGGGGGASFYNVQGWGGQAGLGGGDGGLAGYTGLDSYLSYASGGGAAGAGGGGGGGWSGDSSTAGDGGKGAYSGTAGVAGHTAPPVNIPDSGTIQTSVMAQLATLATLPGGGGNDILDGGPGSDELFGMGGADTFLFEITDAPATNSDTDTIHDFVIGTDTIHLLNGGVLIDAAARNAVLIAQTATPTASDRTLVYTVGANTVTIVVKGAGNNLTASDIPEWTNTAPTVNPSIDASVAIGDIFTVIENGFDIDDHSLTYSYQWKSGGIDIVGAIGSTFTPTINQAHALITVTVTVNDGYGGTSAPTTTAGVTVTNSNPTFNTTPSIDGTAAVGSTLSVVNTATFDADGDLVTPTYQWLANGTPIAGATASTFNVTAAQTHASITVTVTANDGWGGTTSPGTITEVTVANNNPDFIITPSICGTAAEGSTLNLINTATTDADSDIVNLSYQWQLDSADIAGANSATYDVLESDRGGDISSVITADDGNGGSATATTVIVTIPAAASSGGGGAMTWLNWMMGLLLLGSRRLSNRRK